MAKEKKAYPEDFKTMIGVSTMGLSQMVGTSLITGVLMIYITDYAGIYTGIAGKAAGVAALMLLIGRIWDAVNDPILGFVMDRSPRTKWGKFKPFMFWATLASMVLAIILFNIPSDIPDVAKIIWLFISYIVFDTAFTLMPINPLIQSLSNQAEIRTKLLVALRIVTILFSILMSFFFAIAVALGPDGITPNIGLAVIVLMLPMTAISMVGVVLIKEGTTNVGEEQVKFKDVLAMVKANKPLWISLLSGLIGGFSFTFIMAAVIFYIKYAFGAENLGQMSATWGITILFGFLTGTVLAQFVQKKVTPGMGAIIANTISILPLLALWVINLFGPIHDPVVFFPVFFIALIGIGASFIPGTLIGMECMDFNKYKLGKSMEGMISATGAFVMKIQSGIASAITGIVLISVGYNPELYRDATTIPSYLFSGLGTVLFLAPAICAILASVVMAFYPLIKKEKRQTMYIEIEKSRQEQVASIEPA
jgi:Na+/melibiose symporter-like transporter